MITKKITFAACLSFGLGCLTLFSACRAQFGMSALDPESLREAPLRMYFLEMTQQIRRHWDYSGLVQEARPVILTFSLAADGKISRIKIKSSSNAKANQEALKAIDLSAPFKKRTNELGGLLKIQVSFSTALPSEPSIVTSPSARSASLDGHFVDVELVSNQTSAEHWEQECATRIQRTIKLCWEESGISEVAFKRSQVHFMLSKNGHISKLKLRVRSDSRSYDDAVIRAIEKAAPFEAFPESASPVVSVFITFVSSKSATSSKIQSITHPKKEKDADADFDHYLTLVQQKLRQTWKNVSPVHPIPSEVLFTVKQDGSIPIARLNHSSGDEHADIAALHAVLKSEPFPLLPAGAASKVDILFNFDELRETGNQSSPLRIGIHPGHGFGFIYDRRF